MPKRPWRSQPSRYGPLPPVPLTAASTDPFNAPRLLPLALLVWAWLMLVGCSATPHTNRLLQDRPDNLPTSHELTAVPFHAQELYQCGPAALATVLQYSGVDVTPDELVPRIYVPGRQGSFQVEVLAATRHHQRLAYTLEPSLQALLASVSAGQPVLVFQNQGISWHPQWHYAVVVGYDLDKRRIILRSGLDERYVMAMKLFERTWKRGDYWGMVALKPGELPTDGRVQQYFLSAAAFEHNAPPDLADLAWRTGVERWPQQIELLMGYGNFLYNQGDLSRAADHYRSAVEQQPDYAPAYNNLAHILMATGRVQEALTAARRAVAIGGQHNASYRDTLQQAIIHAAAQSN